MEPSPFQAFKLQMVDLLSLSKDAIHMYVGMFFFLLTIVLFRRSPRAFSSLIPVLVLSLLLEAIDIRDNVRVLGRYKWAASLHDILNTNLIPLVLVMLFRTNFMRREKTDESERIRHLVLEDGRGE